ncbi:MAG: hypothetical protein SGI98_03075 [Verrucomicrobiota bacterium]|nr:hypothetical protein [Verrucomicrobiota bacterium]
MKSLIKGDIVQITGLIANVTNQKNAQVWLSNVGAPARPESNIGYMYVESLENLSSGEYRAGNLLKMEYWPLLGVTLFIKFIQPL